MPLTEGTPAPEIELMDQSKQLHRLSDYRGKPVILFFYPKDDTPGCTMEACNFRDDYSEYLGHGAQVLGVSKDTVGSHKRFANKYELPFPLLADVEAKTCEDYDVLAEKSMFGVNYMGVQRITYLIDAQGEIAKVYTEVDPETHSAEVLAALAAL